jgi:Cdc6-like AAA superfamily ATPase
LCGVGKSFTVKEIVSELEDSDHLDDAIMFFKESE